MQLKTAKQRLAVLVIQQASKIGKLEDKIAKLEEEAALKDNDPKWKAGLNSGDIAALEKIPKAKSADKKFLRKMIEMLYKNNLQVLNHRTVKGRAELVTPTHTIAEKLAITPSKLEILRSAFMERIGDVQDDDRKTETYFNTAVCNSVCQIRKRLNTLEKKNEAKK